MQTITHIEQIASVKRDTRYYSLREARSVDELASFLNKRYRIFRDSDVNRLVPENHFGLDIDIYDATSYHLGLFAGRADGTEDLIGYVRLIGEATTQSTAWVYALAVQSPELVSATERERRHVLPSFGYFPEASGRYYSCRRRGETVAEASRLGIERDARSSAAGRFLMLGVTAVWYALKIDHAIFSCVPEHRRFYAPLGAQLVDGTSPRCIPEIGVVGVCLSLSRTTITPEAREIIEPIAASFMAYGDVRSAPNPNGVLRHKPTVQPGVRHNEDARFAVA